jgi:Holliday junction DNA helicase RuvA
MIGRLTGKVVAQEAEGAAVVDVGGVGYEVLVPLGTIGRAASDEGGRCTLYVHTHAREDALTLFGFATDADRLTFRTLIGVSNVGPRTALAILSALPAEDLARAIAAKDLAKLTGIPGIGKKTAERLVLELRDRLVKPVAVAARSEGPSSREAPVARVQDVLLGALTRMGYRALEAERAIATLGPRVDVEPLADLVRDALALLAK